jgi:L-asparaginase
VFRKPHRDLRPLERLSIGEPAAAVKVALLSIGLGADPDILSSLPGFGYNGCVLEAMGAGHVPEDCVPAIAALAAQMPVVLCTRARNGRICERTYGYPGSETDLIARGVLPGGALSGPKARVALLLCLMASAEGAGAAFTRLADAI